MDILDLMQKRYSVRAYQPDPVAEDKLQKVLDAARLAPSAYNRQPFQLVVIHTAGREAELKRVYHRSWFSQAPLVICMCSLPGQAWTRRDGQNYHYVDAAIAMDHLILAATALGLGTCWVAAFDVQAAREVLGLPDDVEPVAFTPLGYPADQPGAKERKNLADLVRYEGWA
ncbi:MAG: nitroreductase family protein [Anaerolineae bacterium]|nr:nitroreductase family protein [Anaerolineae bacterium]